MFTVLQVTPALDVGGVERTTIEVAEAIVRAGGRALVASRGGRWAKDLAQVGGELVPLPLETKNPAEVWWNAGRIAALCRAREVDLIHARSRAPAWSAYWAARRLKLPFVTTYHGIYNARGRLKRWYNSVMARGDVVIANSHFTRTHVLQTYGLPREKVVAIPRGADLDLFSPEAVSEERAAAIRARFAGGARQDGPVVLMPARLSSWKGQRLLIDAAARLGPGRTRGARFVLAGDAQGRDDYVRELEGAIAASGLAGQALLTGHVEDMPAAFAASDLAVFASLEPEAFGRGAVEAQAMGVPVIAARHGGLAETVSDGETGFLFKPGDADDLASAIDRALNMSATQRLAMGAAGVARARASYSKASLQEATLRVYQSLLERWPKRKT